MTQEYFQPVLDWIAVHPNWAGFIVFLISLIESLAVIGLIVPGAPIMFAIGLMMGTGDLPFWQTLSWAILGAVVGDAISYWLGYHFHEHLRDFWPFRQFPGMLKRGETFFKNHGGKSIILGRFGPIRPVIPVIAGMLDMKPKRFFFFNVLSAFIWAPSYTFPGVLVGISLGSLSPEVAKRAVVLVLVFVLALWVVYMFLRTIGSWIARLIQKGLSLLWRSWQKSRNFPWLHQLFRTSQGSEEGQLGLGLLFLFAIIGFIFTTFDVISNQGLVTWNEPVYQVFRALYSDKVITWFAFLTDLGNPWVLLPTATVVGLWLVWRKRITPALCWGITIGLGFMICNMVKILTKIPRPEGLIYLPNKNAFPSLHTLTAVLVFGLTAAFIHKTVSPKRRWMLWTATILLILTVALSRLYLGMHWFTDIIGSITLGIASVALGMWVYRRLESKLIPLSTLLIPGFLALTLCVSFYATGTYTEARKELVRQWPTHLLIAKDWWQGKGIDAELYRTGAFKRNATLLDVQWLASLPTIQTSLEIAGWKTVPRLNFKTAPYILENEPLPELFPIMPKFHRDRLPALIMAKSLSKTKRLVLQLWQSDYQAENKIPLWVGTLRLEEASHPVPLITLYLESPYPGNFLKELTEGLSKWTAKSKNRFSSKVIVLNHNGNGNGDDANPANSHNPPHAVLLIKNS